MIVSYLKHEISVVAGGRSSGEVAHVVVDGARRCFLGGLDEAKRFLRERKAGPHYGPRQASWGIYLDGGSSSHYASRERAVETCHYFAREGMSFRLVRSECCAHPGCDGYGEVSERGRRGFTVQRPCPHHVDITDTVEEVES